MIKYCSKLFINAARYKLYRKGGFMAGRHSETGKYDGKYGDTTVSWQNPQKQDESFTQYNVKNVENGDHHFLNTRTGVQGTALGDYRPGRD